MATAPAAPASARAPASSISALRSRPVTALLVAQVAAIAVLGLVTAFRFHIFAAVDERAHVAYVQEVAEHGRLPWLGRDHVSSQVLAIDANTYPRPSGLNPRRIGLRGESYEAFQPPLYYLLAAPVFALASNYRHKVIAVRLLDVVLLLAAVAILGLLCRAVFAADWRVPYALGLSVMLWPGVIVRAVTVSNEALELPLTLAYLLLLWLATERAPLESGAAGPALLVAAGGLLGLCVLTQLTLICLAPLLAVPAIELIRARRDRTSRLAAGGAVALAVVLLVPWLASNESRYGSLTASSLARQLQRPYVDPTGRHYGLGSVISWLSRLPHAALPQEWWPQYGRWLLGALAIMLPAALVVAAVAPVVREPRLLRSHAALLLGAPVLLGLLTLVAIVVVADWPSFLPRYVNPMLPALAVFAAWASWHVAGRRPWLLGLALGSSALAAFLWIYMAGAYYFTNVGASLGIHA